MYEAEYRFALQNTGFNGFRVLLFQRNEGIKAASGEPGLIFTVNFGRGTLNTLHMGDTINILIFQIRLFEVKQGDTDRPCVEAVNALCGAIRDRKPFACIDDAHKWVTSRVGKKPVL